MILTWIGQEAISTTITRKLAFVVSMNFKVLEEIIMSVEEFFASRICTFEG